MPSSILTCKAVAVDPSNTADNVIHSLFTDWPFGTACGAMKPLISGYPGILISREITVGVLKHRSSSAKAVKFFLKVFN